MNANYFYRLYGCSMSAPATAPHTRPQWPHIRGMEDGALPANDADSRRYFICCGGTYNAIDATHVAMTAVFYRQAYISYMPMPKYNAAISFQFAGCYMAKFTLGGQTYVCHITSMSGASDDRKAQWNNFVRTYHSRLTDLRVFRPTDPDDMLYRESEALKSRGMKTMVCGLITPAGECYGAVIDYESYTVAWPSLIVRRQPLPGGIIPL